jgi:hypothetical protein
MKNQRNHLSLYSEGQNFGRLLYVAKEEGLDLTLQEKLNHKNIQHINLFVTGTLPENLTKYAFIFLDSVNNLKLPFD